MESTGEILLPYGLSLAHRTFCIKGNLPSTSHGTPGSWHIPSLQELRVQSYTNDLSLGTSSKSTHLSPSHRARHTIASYERKRKMDIILAQNSSSSSTGSTKRTMTGKRTLERDRAPSASRKDHNKPTITVNRINRRNPASKRNSSSIRSGTSPHYSDSVRIDKEVQKSLPDDKHEQASVHDRRKSSAAMDAEVPSKDRPMFATHRTSAITPNPSQSQRPLTECSVNQSIDDLDSLPANLRLGSGFFLAKPLLSRSEYTSCSSPHSSLSMTLLPSHVAQNTALAECDAMSDMSHLSSVSSPAQSEAHQIPISPLDGFATVLTSTDRQVSHKDGGFRPLSEVGASESSSHTEATKLRFSRSDSTEEISDISRSVASLSRETTRPNVLLPKKACEDGAIDDESDITLAGIPDFYIRSSVAKLMAVAPALSVKDLYNLLIDSQGHFHTARVKAIRASVGPERLTQMPDLARPASNYDHGEDDMVKMELDDAAFDWGSDTPDHEITPIPTAGPRSKNGLSGPPPKARRTKKQKVSDERKNFNRQAEAIHRFTVPSKRHGRVELRKPVHGINVDSKRIESLYNDRSMDSDQVPSDSDSSYREDSSEQVEGSETGGSESSMGDEDEDGVIEVQPRHAIHTRV